MGTQGCARKGSQWGLKRMSSGALLASHLLLGILGKCRQTGFAGPTAVVGSGSCLLQLAPVRVEKPHSFGAPHIVPARVRGTREVRAVSGCPWAPGGIAAAKGQNLRLSTHSNPKSISQDWLCESGQVG